MQAVYSDKELVKGLLMHDNHVLRHLYNSMYGPIESFVTQNNGSVEEAKDLFQEGIIALYQNLTNGKYSQNQSTRLTSYFYQICKFKWYSILRSSHKRKTVDTIDMQSPGEYDLSFEADETEWNKNKTVRNALVRLGNPCQKLLLAFYFDERSMKDIAEELNQQPNSVKNAKYRCMKKLKELIKNPRL